MFMKCDHYGTEVYFTCSSVVGLNYPAKTIQLSEIMLRFKPSWQYSVAAVKHSNLKPFIHDWLLNEGT